MYRWQFRGPQTRMNSGVAEGGTTYRLVFHTRTRERLTGTICHLLPPEDSKSQQFRMATAWERYRLPRLLSATEAKFQGPQKSL